MTSKVADEYLQEGFEPAESGGDSVHRVKIASPVESNGAIPVNVQDQTSPVFDLYFIRQSGTPTTLATQANQDSLEIELSDATGFVDGSYVGVFCSENGCFYFGNQIGAPVGNTISLDTPIDYPYESGSSVINTIKDISSAAGTLSDPVVYQLGPIGVGAGIDVDITRIMGRMLDTSTMDDSRFGGIDGGLTNGIVLRHNNTVYENYWNIKNNGEFGLHAFDFQYSDRAPAGQYGCRFRYTFAGQSKHGAVVRLEPGDTLELLIQDSEITDLDLFHVMGQGHFITD